MNFQTFKRISSYTKKYKLLLVLSFVSAGLHVFLSLLAPIVTGQGIDLMIGKGQVDFTALFKLIIFLALIIAFSALFQYVMGIVTNKIALNISKDLRVSAFKKINKLPLKEIDSNAHGNLISIIINDIDAISDGLLQSVTQLFTGVFTIIGTLCFMLYYNYFIAIVVVVVTPLSLWVATFISTKTNSTFKEQASKQGELSGLVSEMIGNQKVVKAFGYESESIEKYEKINEELKGYGQKAQFYSSLANPCTRFVNGIVYAAVAVFGGLSVIWGTLTVGQLSAFLSYANQYTKPFNEITAIVTQIQTAFAAANRVFMLLDKKSEKDSGTIVETANNCKGDVTFSNVDFSYIETKPLIKNFNLEVKSGSKVAIVGPTGCGKTTLINLLMRFYDTDNGTIKVDGIDIKDFKRNSYRSLFGMVLQDTWLYNGTIFDNIAYGKQNATKEEVIQASKAVHAHSFIEQLENGYETMITENGDNISAGQKQLLCIARVMLNKPPILILDEATSNIDTMTELRVQRAFTKMMQGRTSFVVAHRLSTIQEADLILVMKDGNIIEQGNHKELVEKNGFYTNLYQSQFS